MSPPRRAITTLGELLRAARSALRLDQVELSKRVLVSSRQISRWENGLHPKPDEAVRLFRVLSSAPATIVAALAEALGIERAAARAARQAASPASSPHARAPSPPRAAAARSSRTTVAELRASLDAIIYAAAEARDLLPRHLRAFAVELLKGVDRLGMSAKEAALLVALPGRADGTAMEGPEPPN
jgi:transcriptional regulator with XRE-family HTH domain